MFNKVYELPISKDYVQHWGMLEAVREIIQNAIDSESPFEWEFIHDELHIHSRYAILEPKTLLLGCTSKTNNKDAIGSFGEGYKIAMLVLLREGHNITILNGPNLWQPKFKYSNKYESDILCIEVHSAPAQNEGVTFVVGNLLEEDIEAIRESCLHMQDHIGQIKETPKGLILMEKSSKLYVGGLYVCDTEMEYGYSVKPEYLQLERDRQTVSSFDLKLITKDMWFSIEDKDQVAALIERECPDLEYADWSTPEIVKEACYRLFQSKHPDAVAVKSQDELNAAVEKGMTNTIYVGGIYYSCITGSNSYRAEAPVIEAPKEPSQILAAWFVKNKKYMRTPAIVSFKEILRNASLWKRH